MKGKGCLTAAFMALTAMIAYQMYSNLTGAMELGGKYMKLPMLLYEVGSLIPGLCLGIHAIKLLKADSEEERARMLHRSKSCIYVLIARVYVGAFALVIILLPFTGYIGSTTD